MEINSPDLQHFLFMITHQKWPEAKP